MLGALYSAGGRVWALFVAQDPALLMLTAALGGLAMSGSIAMTSAMTGDVFGRFSVGSIFGAIFLAHQTGAASAPGWAGLSSTPPAAMAPPLPSAARSYSWAPG